jgi:hypothetical protein
MPIIGWLIAACSTIVGRVLISLGISYVSYKGLDAGITAMKSEFFNSASGLGSTVTGLMGVLKLDVCVNMIASAIVGRLVFAGMTSGTVRRMVFK